MFLLLFVAVFLSQDSHSFFAVPLQCGLLWRVRHFATTLKSKSLQVVKSCVDLLAELNRIEPSPVGTFGSPFPNGFGANAHPRCGGFEGQRFVVDDVNHWAVIGVKRVSRQPTESIVQIRTCTSSKVQKRFSTCVNVLVRKFLFCNGLRLLAH